MLPKVTQSDCVRLSESSILGLSQYLGHILVEMVTPFFLLPTLQTPVVVVSNLRQFFKKTILIQLLEF